MPKESKPEICPAMTVDHDKEKYHIEIEPPGAKKEEIELDMGDQSFCIKAPSEDVVYNACYTLAHTVDTRKVNATFNNGLLKVTLPFKSKLGGTRVAIK
jgi:HSP20 family protein